MMQDEEILGKAYDARLLRRLLRYARPHRRVLALSVLLLLAITAADLARPYIIKVAIDDYLTPGGAGPQDARPLYRLGLLYLLLVLGAFLLNYAQAYLLTATGQRIILAIRQQVFAHLQGMSLSFFDANPTGRLVTRVTNDTEALNEMYTEVLVNLCKDFFLLAGTMAVMLSLDVPLALLSFLALPLIVLATVLYQRQARAAYRDVRVRLARLNAFLQEHLAGFRVVRSLGQEARTRQSFTAVNEDLYQANLREMLVFAIYRPSMDLVSSLALALLVWYGGGGVARGAVSFGVLYALINYVQQFFRPINDLAEKYSIMQSAMAAAERIFQLLDTDPGLPEPAAPHRVARARGEVACRELWFAYHPGEWVLQDISFTIPAGSHVALVGATGAGKTSLVSLFCRLYDPQRGAILLDGVDLRLYAKADLRRQFGVVLQEPFLFASTIRENIRLNNPAISDRQVEEAARRVGADRFIRRLPAGYDEPVLERGVTLSAGQRQLIALARVLAFDPPVLILDEATANIDTESEWQVLQALEEVTRGRTTITIAHRLTTVRQADRVLVLHRGRLAEEGTHRELLARRGIYYDLYRLQHQEPLSLEG